MSNLTLFCLLDGDAPSQSFPVTAQPNITVGEFKELVKIKKAPAFDAFPAYRLILWQVSIPVNDDNEDHPIALNVFEGTKVKLRPTTRLCTVFTEELPEETIHFMVRAPSAAGTGSPRRKIDVHRDLISDTQLKAQFQRKYHDPSNVLNSFMNLLDSIANKWDRSSWYAAMTAIIQSSGSGKTRIIREVGQKRYVIYCCLRPSSSTGFPPRSGIANELLSEKANSIHFYVAYLLACIDVFREVLQKYEELYIEAMSPAIWFDWHVFDKSFEGMNSEDNQFWSRVDQQMRRLYQEIENIDEFGLQKKLLEAVKSVAQYVNAKESKSLQASSSTKSTPSRSPDREANSKAHLLFVFDEARHLNTLPDGNTLLDGGGQSHSYWLRLALRLLPAHGDKNSASGDVYTVAVFLDTSSRVGDFVPQPSYDSSAVPQPSYDSSARVSRRELRVFPPFYLMATFDSLAASNPPDSISSATKEDWLISLGRPLWLTTYDANGCKETVRLARQKIMCTDKILSADQITQELALSILSPRVAIDVNPALRISNTLVADHMRVCGFITPDRDCMLSAAPSEPILAEASTQLMKVSGYLTKILSELAVSLRFGIVDAGYRGELVAQLLILLALDRVEKGKNFMPYSRVVTVHEFLTELLGEKYAVDDFMDKAAMEKMKKGEIFLTHFQRPTYTPNRAQFLEFAVRGAGILCRRNAKKADIAIPFVLPSEEKKRKRENVLPNNSTIPPERVSYLILQVKNRKTAKTGDRSRSQMAPEKVGFSPLSADVPYGVIWMELGVKDSGIEKLAGCSVVNPKEKNQFGLIVSGLNEQIYPCVKDDNRNVGVAKKLRYILESWPDPLNLASDEAEKAAVKNMLPLQYECTNNAQS